jgi:hypothetical protein
VVHTLAYQRALNVHKLLCNACFSHSTVRSEMRLVHVLTASTYAAA